MSHINFLNSLYFHDYFIIHNKVRSILAYFFVSIKNLKLLLNTYSSLLNRQIPDKCIFINFFKQSASHCIMNIKRRV